VKSKSILLIEDDKPIRDMLRNILELEGHSVACASNGQEGIEQLNGPKPPDVILLDMMMPVMSGWDFLDFMRANASTSRIPVIVVSAYDEIAKSVHPDAFVPKPVQLKALLQAIERCAA
jgi:CheY-like chemotaxis protein